MHTLRRVQLILVVTVLMVPQFVFAEDSQIYRELEISVVEIMNGQDETTETDEIDEKAEERDDELDEDIELLSSVTDEDDESGTVTAVQATKATDSAATSSEDATQLTQATPSTTTAENATSAAKSVQALVSEFQEFTPFDERFINGAVIDTGDLNGDGIQEIVVMQSGGDDAISELNVYTLSGELLASTIPYQKVWVGDEHSLAVGDIDGDGKDEIALSRPRGEDSSIYILNEKLQEDEESKSVIKPFSKLFKEMEAGVSVDIANVVNNTLNTEHKTATAAATAIEKEELIVATGAGVAPQIAILNELGKELTDPIIPFAETDTHGLSIAAVDTVGLGIPHLFVGFLNPGKTNVKSYQVSTSGEHPVLAEFTVWDSIYDTGVRMEGMDINADGTEEIAITPAGDAPAEIRFYRGDGQLALLESSWVYEDDFLGGADMAVVMEDDEPQLITVPTHQRAHGTYFEDERWIEVDVGDQTTTLWQNGYQHRKYYISSGLPGTPTPIGEFSILKKLPTHVYDGRPEYFYPNTKWNLRYKAGAVGQNYYFHTAYWHNNFGKRMSHGCVNMRENEAEYLYNWSNLGTRVWIHN